MSIDPNQAKAIFLNAVELSSGGERDDYLQAACGDDDSLRGQVEALLLAHERAGSFLEQNGESTKLYDATVFAERPGMEIDRFKLREQIGEGGMGVVFAAQQTNPVRRMVALKVIKPGMDTKEVLARFDAERQALALMDHPHIARVFDGGATKSGRPYFVMELVRGVPITEFCDNQQLDTQRRLEVFCDVCAAIQHAHQKGIIHRDIKPSNVLVTLNGDEPVVKVIDFGVAKAINQELAQQTIYTRFAQMVGTPLYMSPEQAEMSGLDVDTRSDIYSLGVLIYELLTGQTPFDKSRLSEAGFDEIRRIIREEQPPRPSHRLSTLKAEDLSTVSQHRRSMPQKLSQSFKGELDWIVLKALEKDRSQRYETASALAEDVRRYLNDEPVIARPPSNVYRLKKLVRRNRGLFAGGLTVALSLILATAVSLWQTREANAAKDEAFVLRDNADKARDVAVAAEKRAKIDAATTRAAIEFVAQDLLGGMDLELGENPDPQLKMITVLDHASEAVENRFKNQPEAEATIRLMIGNAYRGLGSYLPVFKHLKRAVELREQTLGPKHRDTLAAKLDLGFYSRKTSTGRHLNAEGILKEVLEAATEEFGDDDPLTLAAKYQLGSLYLQKGQFGGQLGKAEGCSAMRSPVGVEFWGKSTSTLCERGSTLPCSHSKKAT